jgi:hypothetical protein
MTVLKVAVELFPLTASLKTVIPAKAGTHADQPAELASNDLKAIKTAGHRRAARAAAVAGARFDSPLNRRGMGPGLRRDDGLKSNDGVISSHRQLKNRHPGESRDPC